MFLSEPCPASSSFLLGLFQTNILHQIDVPNVHPVSGSGIWTHDLLNMSLLP